MQLLEVMQIEELRAELLKTPLLFLQESVWRHEGIREENSVQISHLS
jgi:hypothetical protein